MWNEQIEPETVESAGCWLFLQCHVWCFLETDQKFFPAFPPPFVCVWVWWAVCVSVCVVYLWAVCVCVWCICGVCVWWGCDGAFVCVGKGLVGHLEGGVFSASGSHQWEGLIQRDVGPGSITGQPCSNDFTVLVPRLFSCFQVRERPTRRLGGYLTKCN